MLVANAFFRQQSRSNRSRYVHTRFPSNVCCPTALPQIYPTARVLTNTTKHTLNSLNSLNDLLITIQNTNTMTTEAQAEVRLRSHFCSRISKIFCCIDRASCMRRRPAASSSGQAAVAAGGCPAPQALPGARQGLPSLIFLGAGSAPQPAPAGLSLSDDPGAPAPLISQATRR